jgi:CDP-4-dehydro-6-deoxyglucose reductase, E1
MPDNIKKEIFKKVEDYFAAKKPASSQKIGVAYPCFDHREVNQALDSLLDMWISQGPKVKAFEGSFAKYVGTTHGVGCNSGSSANLLALTALIQAGHLNPGDEVIVPAATFTTVISPILQTGLIPVFVDVEMETYNIDPKAIAKAITQKTKLIMVVHSLGCPAKMRQIMDIADKHGIPVLEDCCEAHGSAIDGQLVGSFGLISTFSFFVAHNMTTGEGGMIMTSDEPLHEILRSIREFGRLTKYEVGQPRFYYKDENLTQYDERYVFTNIGYNFRMTDIAASLGIEQLKKLNGFNAERVNIANFYGNTLCEYKEFLMLPMTPDGNFHSFYGYPIVIKESAPFTRHQLANYLEKNNIETRAFMGGDLSKQPAYVNAGWKKPFDMPNTDIMLSNAFFIGSHPFINVDQRNHIVATFKKFFSTLEAPPK